MRIKMMVLLASLVSGFGVMCAGPVVAQDTIRDEDEDLALLLRLGKVMPPVEMVDTKGGVKNLAILPHAKAVVVTFLDFKCPISNRYVAVLNDLAERYRAKGVVFAAVVCDVESPAELDRHVREFRAGFQIFYDPKHLVSSHFLASITPQTFLIDQNQVLRYLGAIDDQYLDRTTRLKEVKSPHLTEAIDQLLAGKEVTVKHTDAIGCPITRVKKPFKEKGVITFHRDVEPLLQKHCQRCHRPNDVAPFQLLTYEDALNWASDIKDYVTSRKMPPWPITGGLPLQDNISLNAGQIATLANWVDEGCPKGDPADAPKPVNFHSSDAWDDQLPPDFVFQLPKPFHLGAKGEDHYRTVVFPVKNAEELYVRKTQFIPGNKRIVHHSLVFYDGTGKPLDYQEKVKGAKDRKPGNDDYGPGYESGLGLGFTPDPKPEKNPDNPGGSLSRWVPGIVSQENPTGACQVLPPNASLLLQFHYHRTGKEEVDSDSRLAVWVSRRKPEKYVAEYLVDSSFRIIPKGASQFRSIGSRTIPADSELWTISPHMHMLGKEMKLWHQAKDSEERVLLLALDNWDFNWQSIYKLRKPHFMGRGSVLHLEAVFDNSPGNTANPFTPPQRVFLGENATDEMAYAAVGTTRAEKPRERSDYLKFFEKLANNDALIKQIGGK